jgi:hypothetical protein
MAITRRPHLVGQVQQPHALCKIKRDVPWHAANVANRHAGFLCSACSRRLHTGDHVAQVALGFLDGLRMQTQLFLFRLEGRIRA